MNEDGSDYSLTDGDFSLMGSANSQYDVPVSDSDDDSSSSTPWYDRTFTFFERPLHPSHTSDHEATPPLMMITSPLMMKKKLS